MIQIKRTMAYNEVTKYDFRISLEKRLNGL